MGQWLEQLKNVISPALQNAETHLVSGVFSKHVPNEVLAGVLRDFAQTLPQADIILGLSSDDTPLLFELSQSLRIPFVYATKLDLVETDDTETSGFIQDERLLQVRVSGDTLAIAKGAIAPQSRVLVFRDVLTDAVATLGLLRLAELSQAQVIGVACLLEKGYLGGRSRIIVRGLPIWTVLSLAKRQGLVIFDDRAG